MEPSSPSIRRLLRLHQCAYLSLKGIYLVEQLLQVKPVHQLLHLLLHILSLGPLLAELYPADMAQRKGDRVLIEEEQLHLLAEGHVLDNNLLPFRGPLFVMIREVG